MRRICHQTLWDGADLNEQARFAVATAAFLQHFPRPAGDPYRVSRSCLVCGSSFWTSQLKLRELLFTRSNAYCSLCTTDAFYGSSADWTPQRELAVLDAIQVIAQEIGGPPSRLQTRAPLINLTVAARTSSLILRQVLPNSSVPRRPWGEWLQLAGVLRSGWRPSFGTYIVATDGHSCRSLAERHVDDFFHHSGIEHRLEPSYPLISGFSDHALRADWLLEDGTYVEYAGLMSRREYASKITRKREVASHAALNLIVLTEADLERLHVVFRNYLADGSNL